MIINVKPGGGKYNRSSLEKKFEKLWEAAFSDIPLYVEDTNVKGRKFRSDYTHRATKTVIEIHGGQYIGTSGHHGNQAKKDADKQNLLVAQGYHPFILWTTMVTKANIELIGNYIIANNNDLWKILN